MGANTFFPKLLFITIVSLSSATIAMGATSADQGLTGTLGTVRSVVTNGGNITATIDETTGILSAALTPGFTLTTNTSVATPVILTAVVNTSGGVQNALSGTGLPGSTFIVLTNNTVLPTPGAVADASSGAPTPAANANAIAYPVNPPSDVPGELTYTWDIANTRWNGSLTHKNNTDTLLTIPAAAPKVNTFSLDDASGTYQSTITLSFV